MRRVLAVASLQMIGARSALLWPIAILGISFAVNLAIFAVIGNNFADKPITGGLASIYLAGVPFGAITMTQLFPFALGMSVSRREFSAGTALFVLGQSVLYAVLLYLARLLEMATGGWGIRLNFFGVGTVAQHNVLAQLAVYLVPLLLLTNLGVFYGSAYARWRVNGVLTTTVFFILVLGGVAALVTKLHHWPAVGHWLQAQSAVSLFAGWPLLPAVALVVGSFFILRRATP